MQIIQNVRLFSNLISKGSGTCTYSFENMFTYNALSAFFWHGSRDGAEMPLNLHTCEYNWFYTLPNTTGFTVPGRVHNTAQLSATYAAARDLSLPIPNHENLRKPTFIVMLSS